jgi:cell volume regulation protein A
LGDFFVPGDVTLGALAEIYGLTIPPDQKDTTLADHFIRQFGTRTHKGDLLPLGPIALVAHTIKDGHVSNVGLRLAEPDDGAPASRWRRAFQPLMRLVRGFRQLKP